MITVNFVFFIIIFSLFSPVYSQIISGKEGKTIQLPISDPALPSLPKAKESPIESLSSIIKRIKPSIVIVLTYNNKGEFLKLGSGFFISHSGDIITNYHLLQGASYAEIQTSDDKTYPITYIVAEDKQNDIIRLSVDIPSKYILPLSLCETIPEIGERIIVYGSSLGLENTVSDGIVSSVREIFTYGRIIQITAPISPSSSGSPVLNMKGEVIGIATFQFIKGQNLNIAIPSERIANLNSIEEKRTSVGKELFEQEDKEKKDLDYAYEAFNKGIYFTYIKEEYEKALPYWEVVIEIEPATAYFSIGICYEKLGAYTKAVEAYKKVISLNPDKASGHYNLGLAYDNLGLYEDARESYIKAIRIDPDYAEAHFSLGVAYFMIKDINSALNEYKILKELDIDLANKLFDFIY